MLTLLRAPPLVAPTTPRARGVSRAQTQAGNWELADNEHRRLLCELAGEEAAERKWVYFTEIAAIPEKDMKMLDTLWLTYSKGRYGFSVQRKLWKACKCRWADFFKKIDWVQGENMAYRKWPEEFKWVRTAPLSRASPRARARAHASAQNTCPSCVLRARLPGVPLSSSGVDASACESLERVRVCAFARVGGREAAEPRLRGDCVLTIAHIRAFLPLAIFAGGRFGRGPPSADQRPARHAAVRGGHDAPRVRRHQEEGRGQEGCHREQLGGLVSLSSGGAPPTRVCAGAPAAAPA